MCITLEQAKALKPGDILYVRHYVNSDGTPQRFRVNGKPKTWKRNPERVWVPLKRGLYQFEVLTETDLDTFSLEEPS
jgi:hypothetical protein